MPYPNEHAARVKSPTLFIPDSFRRKIIAPGVDIVMGKLKGGDGSMVAESYRFNKEKFTAGDARKWLKDNKIAYLSFEAAKAGS